MDGKITSLKSNSTLEDREEMEKVNIRGATAIYARISEDRQEGAGVDRQLKDCRAVVKRHGWGRVREFVDNNRSAFNGKVRPNYAEMLAAVKAGQVGRIVVYNLDRLYRRPKELEEVIELAEHGRVAVVTCNGGDLGLGDEEGDGAFYARLLVNVANKSSKDTGRRVRAAKKQARDKGLPMGGPRPFGWMATPRLDRDGQPLLSKRGLSRMTWRSDQPDPREAQLIREAIDNLLAGGSLRDIARRWNEAGVGQPQTGRANWQADGIRQVVSNPRHAALVGYRRHLVDAEGRERYLRPEVLGETTKWPAIIERKKWEQLASLLNERGAGGRIPRRRSLLTGLVLCSKCDATMSRTGARGADSTGAVRKVWRCPSVGRLGGANRGCGNVSIDAEGLESLLTEATLRRADTVSLTKMVREQGSEGKQAAELVRELDELRRREDVAAASYAAGRIPVRAFEKTTAMLQRSQLELQARLGQLTSTSTFAPYVGRPGVLRKKWVDLSVDQRRAIIGAMLGQVRVLPAPHPGRPRFDAERVQIAPHITAKRKA
jgi:site-specific DNA recombinase